jgi:hypothetical protein
MRYTLYRTLAAFTGLTFLSGVASANIVDGTSTEEFVPMDDCYYVQFVNPVCGSDQNTYMNAGEAYCNDVITYVPGECASEEVVSGGVTTEEVSFDNVIDDSESGYFGDIDSDGDGLSDLAEENLGTDPKNPDDDDDGIWDGAEVSMGMNPLNDDLLFSDFDEVDWSRDYIVDMVTRGGINGYEDGTFRPGEHVTRAELLKMMISSLHYDLGAIGSDAVFDDVDSSHWSAQYINYARGAGIISGYDDNTFKPNDKITRSEAIKVMTRLVGFPLDVVTDTHFKDLDGWQIPYVENARLKGIVTVTEDKMFRPNDLITRAEVAKIASNYLRGRY